jgi:hypothetical protein
VNKRDKLSLDQVWHLALTDDVVIHATTREVLAKAENEIGFRVAGVLGDGVSIEDAEAEILEAYGK